MVDDMVVSRLLATRLTRTTRLGKIVTPIRAAFVLATVPPRWPITREGAYVDDMADDMVNGIVDGIIDGMVGGVVYRMWSLGHARQFYRFEFQCDLGVPDAQHLDLF